MSTSNNVLNNLIEQKLLNLHTAFFAKVISVNGDGSTAKIQPLNMIKATGKSAQTQAVMTVPVLSSVKKITSTTETKNFDVEGDVSFSFGFSFDIPQVSTISAGDIVFCLCGERDITNTKNGNFDVPTTGHHRMSDAVVIGVI